MCVCVCECVVYVCVCIHGTVSIRLPRWLHSLVDQGYVCSTSRIWVHPGILNPPLELLSLGPSLLSFG